MGGGEDCELVWWDWGGREGGEESGIVLRVDVCWAGWLLGSCWVVWGWLLVNE